MTPAPVSTNPGLSNPVSDRLFAAHIRSEISNAVVWVSTDAELIEMGKLVVDAYNAGVPIGQLADILMDGGFTAYDAGYFIGASLAWFS